MKKTALFKNLVLAATAALVMLPASADYNKFGIPDSAEIRRVIKDSWLTAPLTELRNNQVESRKNTTGTTFQIRLEEGAADFKIIVAPQSYLNVDQVSGNEHRLMKMEVYPEGAPGSWVLYRDKTTGKPTKVCWYFNADSEVYVQFRPQDSKTLADMVVFGLFAARSVPAGVPFDTMYTASFAQIYSLTQKSLPWQKVTVVPKQYHSSLQMAGIIRQNSTRIDYAEDACYNENGKLYSIITGKPLKIIAEDDGVDYNDVVGNTADSDKNDVLPDGTSVNDELDDSLDDLDDANKTASLKKEEKPRLTLCSAGFLKWIVDGLVEPATGSALKIGDLLEPTVKYDPLSRNGVLSQTWNLSFSLDWCRNLAAKALSTRSSRVYTYKDGGVDVTVEPFASELIDGKVTNTAGYIADAGYSAKKIKGLLYVLAVTEPAYCYLAAIRQQSKVTHTDVVFSQCAILFPYFDDTGRFGCIVFENGREMTLETFCGKYSDCYIHLERVKTNDAFFPQ